MKRFVMIASTAFLALTVAASAEGDVKKGEKVFKKCKACHAIGPDAKNKVGPELNGIVGRKVAGIEDFKYSPAMKKFGEGDKVWDEATLDTYLTKPKKVVPKTKMAFAGLKKEKDRQNIIAYLAQFNADGSMK